HYWMHNNMITLDGKKMGKSLGNYITLQELFEGTHPILAQAYDPMTIRFFILQAHYRGTLDFSNDALQASEKGLRRVLQAAKDLHSLAKAAGVESVSKGTAGHDAWHMEYGEFLANVAPEKCEADSAEIRSIFDNIYEALCDDLNTPVALSQVFEAVKIVNSAKEKKTSLTMSDLRALLQIFDDIVAGVLGLTENETADGKTAAVVSGLMDMVLETRKAAKAAKDWALSDHIRDCLKELGIQVKDTKDGAEWSM
ncbi:MAG: DALR domain-containing protein, partial [Candidatus Cryptobacteroides sp.]